MTSRSTFKRPSWLSPLQADSLFAGGLAAFAWLQATIWMTLMRPGHERQGPPPPLGQPSSVNAHGTLTPLGFLLIGAVFLPLALRRKYPLPVLAAVTLASVAFDFMRPHPPVMTFIGVMVAMYTVATMVERRTMLIAASLTVLVSLAPVITQYGNTRFWADAALVTTLVVAAAAFGVATRNQRQYLAETEQRAIDAERTREEEARRRVDEERLRIARELHDVTAHSLSIIAVQSGAAERVVDRDPDAARRALESIRQTSKTALDELRSMLGVLRAAEDDMPLDPSPTLDRIDELVAVVREAGVDVRLQRDTSSDIPSVVDASAYRIVQEALTNVVRHAHATHADVTVQRSNGDLVITVTDDGVGAAGGPKGEGHGIAGMRERVTALGGTFEAAPGPGGGFTVRAKIPVTRR